VEVDVELLGLERSRRLLLDERAALLQVLRTALLPARRRQLAGVDARPRRRSGPRSGAEPAADARRPAAAGAALVFAVVTYERLGPTGPGGGARRP
jgi:hypothetical protein